MFTITYNQYLQKVAEDDYYKNRWTYFEKVIEEAVKLSPTSVLEVGARSFPIFPECVTMDKRDKWLPTVVQDAGTVPWPFKDKQFDLFIALQVWEHLDGKQIEAFKEVKRVAKTAIMSFPYKWKITEPDAEHSNLDESVFTKWTNNEPCKTFIIGTPVRSVKRIIYVFDNLQ